MTEAEKSEAREFVKEILSGVFQIQLHSSLKAVSYTHLVRHRFH